MKDRSLLLIDAVGMTVLLTLCGAVGWYVLVKPDTASSQMHAFSAEVRQLRANLTRLHRALDSEKSRRRDLRAAAEALGRLPTKSPIDHDLETITSLARGNDVKILEVLPTSTVRYPNVLEHQYWLKTSGLFSDQVRFLQAFEQCSFWADVTYLRISQTPAEMNTLELMRQSELTVSFYSAFQ